MIINLENKIATGNCVLVVPIFEGESPKNLKELPSKVSEFFAKVKENKEFLGKKGEKLYTYIEDKNLPEKLFLIGLGKKENFKYRVAKETGAMIGKQLKAAKAKEATIFLPNEVKQFITEILEGLLISQYEIDKLKTKFSKKENHKSYGNLLENQRNYGILEPGMLENTAKK